MNEQLLTPPAPNPDQDQLFNADLYDPAVQAERTEQAEAVYQTIDPSVAGEEVKLDAPMDESDTQAHIDALTALHKDTDSIPEGLKLKRDWSDTLAAHEEKQAEHVATAKAVLTARLEANAKAHKTQNEREARQDRINAHNEKIDQHKTERDERKEVEDNYVSRQKLLKGTMNIDAEDEKKIAKEAKEHVAKTLGEAQHEYGVVDTAKLKAEREATPSSTQAKNATTSEALRNFQRGFANKEQAVDAPEDEAKYEKWELDVATAEQALHGEDRIVRDDKNRFYAVIDGMGGAGDGDIAAVAIQDGFTAYWNSIEDEVTAENAAEKMRDAFQVAHYNLSRTFHEEKLGNANMGAVVSALRFFENPDGSYGVVMGHVGDTRVIFQEGEGNTVMQFSKDEAVSGGIVTNALSASHAPALNQFICVPKLKPNTRFAIISDGISGDRPDEFLSQEEYLKAFDMRTEQATADELIRLSKKHDDKSVIVIDLSKALDEQEDAPEVVSPDEILSPDGEHFDFGDATSDDSFDDDPTKPHFYVERRDFRYHARKLLVNAQNKWSRTKEKSKENKLVAAGVVGALALGGALGIYLAHKTGMHLHKAPQAPDQTLLGTDHLSHGATALPTPHLEVLPGAPSGAGLSNHAHAAREHLQTAHEHLNSAAQNTTVRPGQNPWSVSEHQLQLQGNAHPSAAQIEAYDKHMAQLNPDVYSYNGDSSEHIVSGTNLKLPKR